MDETTKEIIAKITRKYAEPQPLPSGHKVSVFYDCLQLSPNDLARLAAAATGDLPQSSFDIAVGLAYTGIFFAFAIAGGRQVGILQVDQVILGPDLRGRKVILVDDVICTGSRIFKAEDTITRAGASVVAYACVVNRSTGKLNKPLYSAFSTELS